MRKDLKDASETSTTRAAMNVRYVWSAICAIAIAFLVCTTANDDGDGGFVRARGTQLHVNGTPWYCAGTNAYYAGLQYIMSDDEVEVMMKSHASEGATVLRVFAHSNFATVPSPMMPSFETFDDAAIRRLDVALAMAGFSTGRTGRRRSVGSTGT